jgi:transcriptional regulator with GAF, ATPase, and Fis domain
MVRSDLAGDLSQSLAAAEDPAQAIRLLLRGLVHATQADGGAVILREEGGYEVACAETADEQRLPDAATLLSDGVVRAVFERGEAVFVRDVALDAGLGSSTSIVSRRLRSLMCAPMKLGTATVGAIYLGKRGGDGLFHGEHAEAIASIASMVVPLLASLRRSASGVPRDDVIDDRILGDSHAMARVRELVRRVADSTLAVLITGPTGTGKDVVARAIHEASSRRDHAMVALNCAAVPEGLLAGELFGAAKGAYTGAVGVRRGRIELAHGSTLFLDEVGDMPLPMQAMLLRVLEDKTVTRLGDESARPADFRLIAATHRDLDEAVERREFREDLLYRLREFPLELPPLRDRDDDVVLLARLFVRQTEAQLGIAPRRLSPATVAWLRQHPWPGNVRELKAAIRRASILADGSSIEPEHLALGSVRRQPAANLSAPANVKGSAELRPETSVGTSTQTVEPEMPAPTSAQAPLVPLAEAREQFTARYCNDVLIRFGGNREAAAAALGISVRSLYRYQTGR